MLWLGYDQREATGTSLAAICIIGALAAAVQAAYGNVDFVKGLAIGAPAIGGRGRRHRAPAADLGASWWRGLFVALLVVSAAILIF